MYNDAACKLLYADRFAYNILSIGFKLFIGNLSTISRYETAVKLVKQKINQNEAFNLYSMVFIFWLPICYTHNCGINWKCRRYCRNRRRSKNATVSYEYSTF